MSIRIYVLLSFLLSWRWAIKNIYWINTIFSLLDTYVASIDNSNIEFSCE